jgi:Na+-transporting NADH:ubiquinone oxidoreductase subunit F
VELIRLRQIDDPGFFVERRLPTPALRTDARGKSHIFTAKGQTVHGWIEVCVSAFLVQEDVIRFDHEQTTYAIYRTTDGTLYATDGICTHGNTHLADGLVKGKLIECPKHNGRFDITDGSPQRQPACVALKTYQVREHDGKIFLDLASTGGCGLTQAPTAYRFRVVRNESVATFIKELVLEAAPGSPLLDFRSGDYMQFDIPAYRQFSFEEIAVKQPFAAVWKSQRIFDCRAENAVAQRRNYSIASNPAKDRQLRFNVRIATPPRGQDCLAGAGL